MINIHKKCSLISVQRLLLFPKKEHPKELSSISIYRRQLMFFFYADGESGICFTPIFNILYGNPGAKGNISEG